MQTFPDPDAPSPVPPADLPPDAGSRRPRRPLIATLRAPWARVLTTTLIVLAALAYILGRTIPGGLGDLSAHLFAPTPTRVAAATVTPTATPIIPTPLPASGLLAPPPPDCPAAVSLGSIIAQPAGFSEPVQMFGRSPVWVPEPFLPQNPAYVSRPSGTYPYPQLKIVWEIGPTQHPEVTARVTDVRTAELAWWTNLAGTPATPVFDIPAGPAAYFGWLGGPSVVAITHAGCYRLDVSWNGGGWYIIFAAGGSPHPG
jgi:hypothetical protein